MMGSKTTRTWLLGLSASLCLAAGEPRGAEKAPEEKAARSDERATRVVYQPPRLGSPRTKVGGGVRGARALPTPLALAPDHVALTRSAMPSLFWHLDAVAGDDPGLRFVFTLIESEAIEPLLELDLAPPSTAGIQRIRLDHHGVELALDTEYEWTVSLVANAERRAQDLVSQGFIMRVEAERDGAPPDAAWYAENGLWYDALESLCDAIEASPDDPALRAARSSLLRQARLEAAGE